MTIVDETILRRVARLNLEAMAMNNAALAEDLDEARFRAQLIHTRAMAVGLSHVARVAEDVVLLLRAPGGEPLPGYGHAMLRLAKALTPDRPPGA